MSKEGYATLWAYIKNQEEVIDLLFEKIFLLQPENEDKAVNLSYQLHNLYSAYEDLFKEISMTFENNVERSSGYHKNLLIRMKLDIPGIRPHILSNISYQLLGELLGFRHVFRHAYSYELSENKMLLLKDKIMSGKSNLQEDISKFMLFLEENFSKK